MEIHGFNKTTLLDYPEHIAATVFTGGCNFRCPFCHNGELVLDPGCQPSVPEEEVLAYLKKGRGSSRVSVSPAESRLCSGIFASSCKDQGAGVSH